MKLGAKITLPVVGVATGLVLVGAGAVALQGGIVDVNRRAASMAAQVIEASEVRALSRAVQRDALKLADAAWGEEKTKLAGSIESRSKQLLARASKLAGMVDPADTEMSRSFVGLQSRVVDEIAAARKAALAERYDEAKEALRTKVQPAERAASKLTDNFIDKTEAECDALSIQARAAEHFASLAIFTITLVCLIMATGAALLTARRGVVLPLRRIVAATQRLSRGDREVEIADLGRGDEIGDLAEALTMFRDAAVEKARLEREAAVHRDESDRQRLRAEEDRSLAIKRERETVACSIGAALTRLAAKDLSHRLTSDMPEAYARLRVDFNAAMADIAAALSRVAESAETIQAGARDVLDATNDLSQRTELEASSLEQTTAALGEVTAAVQKAAEGARHARSVAAAVETDMKASSDVVDRAVEAMNVIANSSQAIGQIIAVIDEIAFQTSLLALNAGVEAARAGDAGKGFAVVASEVRGLAQRSAEAAKEIKGLVGGSSAQVKNGVELVCRTGQVLQRIATRFSDINEVVLGISSRADEQATSLRQINEAMERMNATVQRNASMVEETTSASRSLSEESGKLARLVGEFQMEGEAPARRRAA